MKNIWILSASLFLFACSPAPIKKSEEIPSAIPSSPPVPIQKETLKNARARFKKETVQFVSGKEAFDYCLSQKTSDNNRFDSEALKLACLTVWTEMQSARTQGENLKAEISTKDFLFDLKKAHYEKIEDEDVLLPNQYDMRPAYGKLYCAKVIVMESDNYKESSIDLGKMVEDHSIAVLIRSFHSFNASGPKIGSIKTICGYPYGFKAGSGDWVGEKHAFDISGYYKLNQKLWMFQGFFLPWHGSCYYRARPYLCFPKPKM